MYKKQTILDRPYMCPMVFKEDIDESLWVRASAFDEAKS